MEKNIFRNIFVEILYFYIIQLSESIHFIIKWNIDKKSPKVKYVNNLDIRYLKNINLKILHIVNKNKFRRTKKNLRC